MGKHSGCDPEMRRPEYLSSCSFNRESGAGAGGHEIRWAPGPLEHRVEAIVLAAAGRPFTGAVDFIFSGTSAR